MHLSDCPRCGRRELRGDRAVHAVHTDAGDVLALTCRRCGSVMAASSRRLLRPTTVDALV